MTRCSVRSLRRSIIKAHRKASGLKWDPRRRDTSSKKEDRGIWRKPWPQCSARPVANLPKFNGRSYQRMSNGQIERI